MLEVFSYQPQIAYFTYFISISKIMGGYVRTPRNLQRVKYTIIPIKKGDSLIRATKNKYLDSKKLNKKSFFYKEDVLGGFAPATGASPPVVIVPHNLIFINRYFI